LSRSVPPRDPQLVRIRLQPEEPEPIEIGMIPLGEIEPGATHPVQVLAGFDAPDDWHGIGVVVSGTVRSLSPAPDGGRPPEPGRVVHTHLFTRDGVAAGSTHACDKAARALLTDCADQPPEGRVADLLARALGIDLDRKRPGPATWVQRMWLDAVAPLALQPEAPLTWRRAAAVHPLLRAELAEAAPGADPPSTTTIRRLHRELDHVGWPWLFAKFPELAERALDDIEVDEPQLLLDWVGPAVMGSWLVDHWPPERDLLDLIEANAPEGIIERLERCCARRPPRTHR
jgi:hypothetical protein